MPADKREKMRTTSLEKLCEFQSSMKDGRIAKMTTVINSKIDNLVTQLTVYLGSKEGKECALRDGVPVQLIDVPGIVQDVAISSFHKTITNFPGYTDLCKWVDDDLQIQEEIKAINQEFRVLQTEIGGRQSLKLHEVPREGPSPFFYLLLLLVPWVAPFFVIQKQSFRFNVKKAYSELVKKATEIESKQLKDTVTEFLCKTSPSIQFICEDLPKRVEDLSKEVNTRAMQEEDKIPQYKALLKKIKELTGRMALFILRLNMHSYRREAIQWPDRQDRQKVTQEGATATVTKVSVRDIGEEVALKLMKDPITSKNAMDFMKELESCR